MIYNYILLAIDQPHLKDTNAVNNVFELLMKGGFIMIPILLLSAYSVFISSLKDLFISEKHRLLTRTWFLILSEK